MGSPPRPAPRKARKLDVMDTMDLDQALGRTSTKDLDQALNLRLGLRDEHDEGGVAYFGCGAAAGTVATVLTNPLDVARVRMQVIAVARRA